MKELKNKLKAFFTEHWNYMAVSAACKLDLFDHLQIAKTANQLASELSLNENKLLLLLEALHNSGFLQKNTNTYTVNPLSELLIENNPESLKYACMNWSGEHLTAWQNLDFSVKTSKSSFEKIYGLPFFDYLNKYPEKLHAYHQAMYQYAIDDYKKLPEIIDFGIHKSVIDVGGGYGTAIEKIKEKNPEIKCTLFDLPKVIERIEKHDIIKISGDFFNKIPTHADAIILSRVLHDWNDEKASLILKNCYEALPKGGTLYIIENCKEKNDDDLSLLSLNMLAMCESFERTTSQYAKLCTPLKLNKTKELNQLQTILIFKK